MNPFEVSWRMLKEDEKDKESKECRECKRGKVLIVKRQGVFHEARYAHWRQQATSYSRS